MTARSSNAGRDTVSPLGSSLPTWREKLCCKACLIKFVSGKEYKQHLDAHVARVRVACLLCGNVFADLKSLETHTKSHCASGFSQTPQTSWSIKNPSKNHKSPTAAGEKFRERIILRIPRNPMIDKVWQSYALGCVSKSKNVPDCPPPTYESVFGSPMPSTASSSSADEEKESSDEDKECNSSSPSTSDTDSIKSPLSSLGSLQHISLSSDDSIVAVDEVKNDPVSSSSDDQPPTKQPSGSIKTPLKTHKSANAKSKESNPYVRLLRNPMIDKLCESGAAYDTKKSEGGLLIAGCDKFGIQPFPQHRAQSWLPMPVVYESPESSVKNANRCQMDTVANGSYKINHLEQGLESAGEFGTGPSGCISSVSAPSHSASFPDEPDSTQASSVSTDELCLALSNSAAAALLPGKLDARAAESQPLETMEMPTPAPFGNLMNVDERDAGRLHKRGKRQRWKKKCTNEMTESERKVLNIKKSRKGRVSARELENLTPDLKKTMIEPSSIKRVRKRVSYQEYPDFEDGACIGSRVKRVRKNVNYDECSDFEEEAHFANQVIAASASVKAPHDFNNIQQSGKSADSHSRDTSKRCLQFAVKLDTLEATEGGPSAKIEIKLIDNPASLDECAALLDKQSVVNGSKCWITNGGSSPCSDTPGSSVRPMRSTSPKPVFVPEAVPSAVPSVTEETPDAENAGVDCTSPKSCDEAHAVNPGPRVAADEANQCQTAEPRTPDFEATNFPRSCAKVSSVCRVNEETANSSNAFLLHQLDCGLNPVSGEPQSAFPLNAMILNNASESVEAPHSSPHQIYWGSDDELSSECFGSDPESNGFPERFSPRFPSPVGFDGQTIPVPLTASDQFSKNPPKSTEKVISVSRESEETDLSSHASRLEKPASGFNSVSSKLPNTAMLKAHVPVNQIENADAAHSPPDKIHCGSVGEVGFKGFGSDDLQTNDFPERFCPRLPSPVSFVLNAPDQSSRKFPRNAETAISASRENEETDRSSNAFHLDQHLEQPDSALDPVCRKPPNAAVLQARVPVNQHADAWSPPNKINWGTDDEFDSNEDFVSDDPKSNGFPGRRSPSSAAIPSSLAASGKRASPSHKASTTPTQKAPDWGFHGSDSDDEHEDNTISKVPVKNTPRMKRPPVRRSTDWNAKKKHLEAIFRKIDELGPSPPERLCRKSSKSHQSSQLGPDREVQREESLGKKGMNANLLLIKSLLEKDGMEVGPSKNVANKYRQNKGLRQILSSRVSVESPVIDDGGSALRECESSRSGRSSSWYTRSTSAEPVRIPVHASPSPSPEPYFDDSGLDSPAAHSPQFSPDEDSPDDGYRYPSY